VLFSDNVSEVSFQHTQFGLYTAMAGGLCKEASMSAADALGTTPLVSVVTPSLNMAGYIEHTILSVLAQGYPRIEYIVMDGGSTDGTLEILERYAGRLRYFSLPDHGAADAINKGWRLASGDICAWLSADDTYLPDAVQNVVAAFQSDPAVGMVYGNGLWTNASGTVLGQYPTSPRAVQSLDRECQICQPAAFVRRTALERVNLLDAGLSSAFDYDLWIRISACTELMHLDRVLATSRLHSANKTLGERKRSLAEAARVQKKNFGYAAFESVYAYCSWRVEHDKGVLSPPRRSLPSFALSLPTGLWINRSTPLRYLRDWIRVLVNGLSRLTRRSDGAPAGMKRILRAPSDRYAGVGSRIPIVPEEKLPTPHRD
jgi:glycosyltransferase involved in cell wall biosynthesis